MMREWRYGEGERFETYEDLEEAQKLAWEVYHYNEWDMRRTFSVPYYELVTARPSLGS